MIGDPGGKQDERQLLDLETIEGYLASDPPPAWRSSSTWTATVPCSSTTPTGSAGSRPSSTCATSASTSPSTRWWPRSPSRPASSDRIRASPTPSSATCCCRPTTSCACISTTAAISSSVAATSGATSPWASTRPQGLRRRGVGPHHAAHRQARRDQVRQDGVGHGLARPEADQPLRHVPVLPQHARRAGGRPAPLLTFLDHDEISRPSTPRRRSTRSGAPPNGRWPGAVVGARARRGRGGQVRGGLGRALRRGDRRPQRGDAARRDRGRADHDRSPAPSCSMTASPSSTSSSAPVWPSSKKEARRTIDAGRRLRQQRPADRHGAHARPRRPPPRPLRRAAQGPREVHIVRAT